MSFVYEPPALTVLVAPFESHAPHDSVTGKPTNEVSHLAQVAQLCADCTLFPLEDVQLPEDTLEELTLQFPRLSISDGTLQLAFTMHQPPPLLEADAQRLYLQSCIFGVLGCISGHEGLDVNAVARSFAAEAAAVLASHGLATAVGVNPVAAHLIVVDAPESVMAQWAGDPLGVAVSFFALAGRDADARRLHLKLILSQLTGLILRDLENDVKMASRALDVPAPSTSAAAASASVSVALPGGVNVHKAFAGARSTGIDVAVNAGINSLSSVIGTGRRRVQGRLLRRRGDCALMAGSPADALDLLSKAEKTAKATSDDLFCGLIAESHAAALLADAWLRDGVAPTMFLPDVAAALTEAVARFDAAAQQPDIAAGLEGVHVLTVSSRLRLARYLLCHPRLPRPVSAALMTAGHFPLPPKECADIATAANPPMTQGISLYPLRPPSWKRADGSTLPVHGSGSAAADGGAGGGAAASATSSATNDAMNPYTHVCELINTAGAVVRAVKSTPHQIQCLLATAEVALMAGLRRKADVMLLRAAKFLRSLQNNVPPYAPEGSGEHTHAMRHRGCQYHTALQIQPLRHAGSEHHDASADAESEAATVDSAWPGPWCAASCTIASRTLPFALRACSPAEIAAALTLSVASVHSGALHKALDGADSEDVRLADSTGTAISASSLLQQAAADFWQAGDLLSLYAAAALAPAVGMRELMLPRTADGLRRSVAAEVQEAASGIAPEEAGDPEPGITAMDIIAGMSASHVLMTASWHRATVSALAHHAPALIAAVLRGCRLQASMTWSDYAAAQTVLECLDREAVVLAAHLSHPHGPHTAVAEQLASCSRDKAATPRDFLLFPPCAHLCVSAVDAVERLMAAVAKARAAAAAAEIEDHGAGAVVHSQLEPLDDGLAATTWQTEELEHTIANHLLQLAGPTLRAASAASAQRSALSVSVAAPDAALPEPASVLSPGSTTSIGRLVVNVGMQNMDLHAVSLPCVYGSSWIALE